MSTTTPNLLATCLVFASALPAAEVPGESVATAMLVLRPTGAPVAGSAVPDLAAGVPDADRLPEAGLALEPERPYRWVFSPGEPVQLRATVGAAEAGDSAILTCWDWELRPVAHLALTSTSTWLTLAVAGRGTYVVTLDRLRAGQCLARLARSVAVCPDNRSRQALWARQRFWVGQCSFPGWQNARLVEGHSAHPAGLTEAQSRELDAALVARLGVQVARINLPVTRRDPGGLDLDFTLADQCAEVFAAHGLALDLQLFAPEGQGRGPVLAAHADAPLEWAVLCPLQEAPYRHYVQEMVRRYGPRARFVQVGNEPGNPQQNRATAAEFLATVSQAVAELRGQFPVTPVTNGGYCSDNEAVQEIIRGLRGVTDFAAYHWHGDLAGLVAARQRLAALHRAAGYKPLRLANTEMGYAMPSLAAERETAMQELQKLLYCWAHGDEGVLLYSSRELWWPRVFSYNGISDYGFVDHFFCPRFVYGAVAALLDHYAGVRFERILLEAADLHAYLFSDGEEFLVAAFAPQGKGSVRLRTDARQAAVLDVMGNRQALPAGHEMTVAVGGYPVTVRLTGASEVSAARTQ
jgi:hypothetical protein